jgi:hypothetical protein
MRCLIGCPLFLALAAMPTAAEIVEIEDKAVWMETVSNHVTIDFTGFPAFTFISDQYEDLGVLFIDQADLTLGPTDSYPNDGWGLCGHSQIILSFTTTQNWIGVDSPSDVLIQLYLNGQFTNAGAAYGRGFEGVLTDQPFLMARLLDPNDDNINLDDLFFGAQLPGDANNDAAVNVLDMIEVVLAWGACSPDTLCFSDLDHDGLVGVTDLISVVVNWSG